MLPFVSLELHEPLFRGFEGVALSVVDPDLYSGPQVQVSSQSETNIRVPDLEISGTVSLRNCKAESMLPKKCTMYHVLGIVYYVLRHVLGIVYYVPCTMYHVPCTNPMYHVPVPDLDRNTL